MGFSFLIEKKVFHILSFKSIMSNINIRAYLYFKILLNLFLKIVKHFLIKEYFY
jgi:hypothetical protein